MRSMVVRLLTSMLRLDQSTAEVQVESLRELRRIRTLLSEQHVCGHGTRGWCPYCLRLLLDGGMPG